MAWRGQRKMGKEYYSTNRKNLRISPWKCVLMIVTPGVSVVECGLASPCLISNTTC